MKTKILIFLLFLSFNNYAQESDSAELRVTYEYAFINDTTTMVITKDITHLLIGNQYSYYFSYLLYRRDSLITIERKKGAGVQETINFIFNYDNHGTSREDI